MGDIEFLGQLVDSLEIGVEKLEKAAKKSKREYFSKLKSFILGLKSKIDMELRG